MKFDYFPLWSGFRQNGALDRRSPTKTKVATLHRYKIVVGGFDGQDPTAACGRLQPGLVTRSIVKFLNFRGRNRLFNLAIFLVSHLPMPYPTITKQKIPHFYPLSIPVEGVDDEV